MEAKILLLLLKNACGLNVDKPIYVSVDKKLIPCTRITSNKDRIVIGTEKEDKEKYLKPNYDIKGFTGIEVNGVRFSNLGEMLRYMNKQKEQLVQAKAIIKSLIDDLEVIDGEQIIKLKSVKEAEQILKEE